MDGNVQTNRTVIKGVTLPAVELKPGDEIFLRWTDINDLGAEDGLAVDDFTLKAEPLKR